MTTNLTAPQAPVTERELDQIIWGLERYGLYPRQLAALKELREWRKTAGEPQNCRSSAKVQVQSVDHVDGESLTSTQTVPALDSSPKNIESPSGMNAEKLNQPVSEAESLPLGYLQGHKDGQEWSAQMAEANHPQTGDWLYDDPIALAAAIRKGPDFPPIPKEAK